MVASSVAAGRDINIKATGDGDASNLNIVGSTIDAGRNVSLDADGSINLVSAQNTANQDGKNSNSGWSAGVGFGIGQQNGFTLELAANKGKGSSEGEAITHANTLVTAGEKVALNSGGDTNLKGAVVTAKQVTAEVGGDFNLASQQDIDNYKSKQQNAGVGLSLCIPPFCAGVSTVSGSFSQQKINSEYASVGQQTGIKAGDNGFQINVGGNTDLQGAIIASNDKAVADGKNSLTTGTLTHSDIENKAEYKGSSISLSGSYSTAAHDKEGDVIKDKDGKTVQEAAGNAGTPIALSASGKEKSTTQSGISAGAITITDAAKQQELTGQTAEEAVADVNRDVSSDKDGSNTLKPIFDRKEIEAGFEITEQFVRNVGTFLEQRAKVSTDAKKELDAEKAKPADQQDGEKMAALILAIEGNKKWDIGGTGRALVSALSAAAGGNVTGGTSQMFQGAAINYLQGLAAEQVKYVADELNSDAARTALHAIVGCAGAAAQAQNCGAGALGAGASVVLNNLLDALSKEKTTTEEQKQNRLNLIGSLIAGISSAVGGEVPTAVNAAQTETGNNHLSDQEMRALAIELKGCELRKDCTPIAQAYMDKHFANKETFEKVCDVSMDACKVMASDMYDAIVKFQTLDYKGELEGQAAQILFAFHQINLESKQEATGVIALPGAEAMVEAMGFDPKSEKAKALILVVSSVMGEKVARGIGRKFASMGEAQKAGYKPCCFAAGTLVSTPSGERAIESLKVGDIVWSKPESGGEPFAAAVTATHTRTDQPIYRLVLKKDAVDGATALETLEVTPGHPFYVPAQKGFVPVIDLTSGDRLQSLGDGVGDGSSITVESITLYKPEGLTYNLTVDIGHTFYVGTLGTWVHNIGPCASCSNGSCSIHAAAPEGGPKGTFTPKDFPEVAAEISRQKQLRHLEGTPQLAKRGKGGYVSSAADAQKVLDAYRSGSAVILGKNAQGFPVVRVEGVTGTNVNIGAGINNQPTNVFVIKGTKSPSIVPTSPNPKLVE